MPPHTPLDKHGGQSQGFVCDVFVNTYPILSDKITV